MNAHRATALSAGAVLLTLIGCRAAPQTGGDSAAVGVDTGALAVSCLDSTEVEVEGQRCTLVTDGGEPLIWYGRDVGPGHPLEVRVLYDDAVLGAALASAAVAWNAVFEGRGILLRYAVDDAPSALRCDLDQLDALPQQAAGFCVPGAGDWAAGVPAEHLEDAYVTRLNSPCDATIRGSMTLLNPDDYEAWGERAVSRSLGHLTSIVLIGDPAALMAEGWTGADLPQDVFEGACAAEQYRALTDSTAR